MKRDTLPLEPLPPQPISLDVLREKVPQAR
jgi:hypothetical protein